jgi:hypothetical protein
MDVYEGGARLLIRCIPRINLAALALPATERRGFKASRGPRPPQRYFDRGEVEDAAAASGGAEIESRMARFNLRCDVWGGRFYHDGMEYREVRALMRRAGRQWVVLAGTRPAGQPTRSLGSVAHLHATPARFSFLLSPCPCAAQVKPGLVTPYGPAPTFDELQKFKSRGGSGSSGRRGGEDAEGGDGDADGAAGGKAALKSAEDALLEQISATVTRGAAAAAGGAGAGGEDGAGALRPGDAVVVVRGELQNVTGRVVAVNPGGTFTLQPSTESSAQLGLTDRMELLVRGLGEAKGGGEAGAGWASTCEARGSARSPLLRIPLLITTLTVSLLPRIWRCRWAR